MKVVLLCRDSVAAIYVANVLAREGLLDAIVLERGTAARKRKLQRLLKKTPAWKLPIAAIDVLALTAYAKLCRRYLIKHRLRPNAYSHYPTATETVSPAYQGSLRALRFHSGSGTSPDTSCGRSTPVWRPSPKSLA